MLKNIVDYHLFHYFLSDSCEKFVFRGKQSWQYLRARFEKCGKIMESMVDKEAETMKTHLGTCSNRNTSEDMHEAGQPKQARLTK